MRLIFIDALRGKFTPFLKCRWDEKETWSTTKASGSREFIFTETKVFTYQTRFFKKLDSRYFCIEVWDSGVVGSKMLAEVKVDILSIVAGPKSHQVTVSDSDGKKIGDLVFQAATSQELMTMTISIENLEFVSPVGLKHGQLESSYLCYTFQGDKDTTEKNKKDKLNKFYEKPINYHETGLSKWDRLEPFYYHDMSVASLLTSQITFQLMLKRGMFSKDICLCEAHLKLFSGLPVQPEGCNFSIPLNSTHTDVNGRLVGKIKFDNSFKFIQLDSGVRIDKVIKDGLRTEATKKMFLDLIECKLDLDVSKPKGGVPIIATLGGTSAASGSVGPFDPRNDSVSSLGNINFVPTTYKAIVVKDPSGKLRDNCGIFVGPESVQILSPSADPLVVWRYETILKWEGKATTISFLVDTARSGVPELFAFVIVDVDPSVISAHITSQCQILAALAKLKASDKEAALDALKKNVKPFPTLPIYDDSPSNTLPSGRVDISQWEIPTDENEKIRLAKIKADKEAAALEASKKISKPLPTSPSDTKTEVRKSEIFSWLMSYGDIEDEDALLYCDKLLKDGYKTVKKLRLAYESKALELEEYVSLKADRACIESYLKTTATSNPSPSKELTPRKYFAICIGNNNFTSSKFPTLMNCQNDAKACAKLFNQKGFASIPLLDATLDDIKSRISDLRKMLSEGDHVVVTISSHGIDDGYNYIACNDTIDYEGFLIVQRHIIEELDGKKLNLLAVFLDACRSSVRDGTIQGMFPKDGGKKRGLADDGPVFKPRTQYVIGYPCATKTEAADGSEGSTSPYTTALLKHIGKTDSIVRVMAAITKELESTPGSRVRPEKHDNLVDVDVVLVPSR